ncbi:MAG: endolytic transglycosylase MltG [Bacteroidales bacterium]
MKKKILLGILLLIIVVSIPVVRYSYWIFGPNIKTQAAEAYLFIRTGATFSEVTDSLLSHGWIKNKKSFQWVAEKKKYSQKVKAGRYLISNGMSNNALINRLRSGDQVPVKLIFNSIRTKQQLAGRIGKQLETDSITLLRLMNDNSFTRELGCTSENILCLFIPNTYEVFWNTGPEKFLKRMSLEYNKFWTENRKEKLKTLGLNQAEASILASIVEMESTKNDEKPLIAGVYLNRLKRGIKLEADPTLIFALGDFSIQRVLNKDLQLDSPYNTYKYTGLPPGPISLPSIASLEAVLSPANHDYLFFCAKADLSGYHNFSKTLTQHMRYAREYQAALNQLNIKR